MIPFHIFKVRGMEIRDAHEMYLNLSNFILFIVVLNYSDNKILYTSLIFGKNNFYQILFTID